MSQTFFSKVVGGNEQLWVTDGTVAGAQLVKAFGSTGLVSLAIGGRLYFRVDDGVHGYELWSSDGTPAGTALVKDIDPGPPDAGVGSLTNVDGTLFFAATDGVNGAELWKSDGTAGGTVLVKDINPGGNSLPQNLFNLNGVLLFQATDGTHGSELWMSDGSAEGTALVKDINPGPVTSNPLWLTNLNGTLIFSAFDGADGDELWRSDGTAAGTVMIKDINPLGANSFPQELTNVNGTLFFGADDGVHGRELWRTDGTIAGTTLVADINPTAGAGPGLLTNVNGTLFFVANDGTNGSQLWKSDGTAAGTVMVKNIGGSASPQQLVNVDGTLFFSANDGVHGFELWKSDGTAAGTMMVADINPGLAGSGPTFPTNVNGVLEFYAFDSASEGLFRSDGTAAGTIELAANVDSSEPIGFAPPPVTDDFNADTTSDLLWRNADGTLADWTMSGRSISSSSALTAGGTQINPDATWRIAATADFNGDGGADIVWRNSDGTVVDWTMSGSVIGASGVLAAGGTAVKPDASWSVAGAGDFDGDSRADLLWRNSDGTLAAWFMNGSSILSTGTVTAGGAAVKPDASWSVAGIGDFNGDNRRDILWRNSSGEVAIWSMNGATIAGGGDVTFGGAAVAPGVSWNVAGIGDFNHDGNSDVLWRNSDGSLAMWLMNGSTISVSRSVTFGGTTITPDASWHLVEIGDFNGDNNADMVWRNDSGVLAEWLMNGSVITQSVTPASQGVPVSPDATWSLQAKPTNFA